ncbi:Protein kinase-like domain [Lasallia pustulata]|uniref:Protein kinase-like domain n=1 Tax=Lasallia pustulata TaxID=136370 RepID=A0A1W5CV50_9LECA|nr:Protein kinase-like domain [Lasallia pustulata]
MAANERSTEGEAIRLVQKLAPSAPVPEAIHFWHDEELERVFIITRRVHGKMLDDVWHSLKREDHKQVAKELAAYTKSLAKITAPAFQDVDGHHLADRCLIPYDSHKLEPFTAEELREHMRNVSNGIEPPECGPEFHLFHANMGPSNVLLSGMDKAHTKRKSNVHIAGIVDWHYAGFYPKFWITTLPLIELPIYYLSVTQEQMVSPKYDYWVSSYMDCLHRAMKKLGFRDDDLYWWIEHYEGMGKPPLD